MLLCIACLSTVISIGSHNCQYITDMQWSSSRIWNRSSGQTVSRCYTRLLLWRHRLFYLFPGESQLVYSTCMTSLALRICGHGLALTRAPRIQRSIGNRSVSSKYIAIIIFLIGRIGARFAHLLVLRWRFWLLDRFFWSISELSPKRVSEKPNVVWQHRRRPFSFVRNRRLESWPHQRKIGDVSLSCRKLDDKAVYIYDIRFLPIASATNIG